MKREQCSYRCCPCFDDAATHSRAILRYLRDWQSMESSGHAKATILVTNEAVADIESILVEIVHWSQFSAV